MTRAFRLGNDKPCTAPSRFLCVCTLKRTATLFFSRFPARDYLQVFEKVFRGRGFGSYDLIFGCVQRLIFYIIVVKSKTSLFPYWHWCQTVLKNIQISSIFSSLSHPEKEDLPSHEDVPTRDPWIRNHLRVRAIASVARIIGRFGLGPAMQILTRLVSLIFVITSACLTRARTRYPPPPPVRAQFLFTYR